jgi:tRNA(Ile)-lysidine synthetase-like protein
MKPQALPPPARRSDPIDTAVGDWFSDRGPAGSGRVGVALSGGLDSTVLAHALARWGRSACVSVFALHVDHRLRPRAELAAERAVVIGNCLAWRLPLVMADLGEGRVAAQASTYGTGIEEAARSLRYRALSAAAGRLSLDAVLTAHHQGDDLESQLMAFFRGQGSGRGIPALRGLFGRPLLCLDHDLVEAYARRWGLSWHEDSSNPTGEYLRNRVRNELVPVVRRLFPGFGMALAGQKAVAEADESLLVGLAGQFAWRRAPAAGRSGDGGMELRGDGAGFFALPFPVRWRALRHACEELLRSGALDGLPGRGFYLPGGSDDAAAAFRDWPASLPGLGSRLLVDHGGVQFGLAGRDVFVRPRIVDCRKIGYLLHLTGNGSFTVPGLGAFSVNLLPSAGAVAVMDLVVRNPRTGDRSPADGRLLSDRIRSWGVPSAVAGQVPVVLRRGVIRAVLTSPWTGRDRWFAETGEPEAEFKYLEMAT